MTSRRPTGLTPAVTLAALIVAHLSSSSPALAAETVDLKLVLATDVSGSINNDELWLERTGTAAAFQDPDVIRAIERGALGRIAVSMLDFSSPGFGKTVIGWRIIRDRASALAFARDIIAIPRTPGNRTSISNALELGAALIAASEKDIVATRKAIDVAGDGPNNDGKPLQGVLRTVMAQGVIINGLPVMDEQANGYFPGLDGYYQACVAGGRGAFVIAVRSYRDFSAAMRRKLILEISEDERQVRQAETDSAQVKLLQHAAVQKPPMEFRIPFRPSGNEYSGKCDLPDPPAAGRGK